MIEENKKTCINCGAEYTIKYMIFLKRISKNQFCPFCGHEEEVKEDENEVEWVENRYEDWN